jgi:hypothetical protein
VARVRDRDLDVAVWRIHRSIGMGGDRLGRGRGGRRAEREHGDALREAWKAAYDRDWLDAVRPFAGARTWSATCAAAAGRWRSRRPANRTTPGARSRSWARRRRADAVTTADDAEASKPAPDILRPPWSGRRAGGGILRRRLGVRRAAAAALGVPCVGVLTGGFSAAS